MLRADSVSYCYQGGPRVLEDVTLHVAPGEVVGLPGPSGQGKTTLGRLLCGYMKPDGGKVTMDDAALPEDVYCPAQLIFQHPELAMNPRCRMGAILNEAGVCDEKILERLGIKTSWRERYPHELSGGELQRVALARVMNSDTKYLVADEITAMLDANTQARIWKILLTWAREQRVGVLAISHDHHLLKKVADRIDNSFTSSSHLSWVCKH